MCRPKLSAQRHEERQDNRKSVGWSEEELGEGEPSMMTIPVLTQLLVLLRMGIYWHTQLSTFRTLRHDN